MNKIFAAGDGVTVPDGTRVFELYGPGRLRFDALPVRDEQSLALGELPGDTASFVHVHPIVTHLTYVLSGKLMVTMKDASNASPYSIDLIEGESVFTAPGTFFQLNNRHSVACRLLYVCSPGFVFLTDSQGQVVYNDQVVPGLDWDELAERHWQLPELADLEATRSRRAAALQRMGAL